VHITAAVSQDGQECRLVMVEIAERNRIGNTHEVQYAGETQDLEKADVLSINI
jgi:hypothetical protein